VLPVAERVTELARNAIALCHYPYTS
jgi:hypothetical protein